MDNQIVPTVNSSSKKMAYTIVVIIAIVLVALWYAASGPTPSVNPQPAVQPSTLEQPQNALPPISSGNTTQDIAKDLSQIPSSGPALTQDQNSLNSSIQGL